MSAAHEPLRILVTGAAGGLGIRLVERLLRAGHSVRGVILPADPQRTRLVKLGCEIWEADICEPKSLAGVCRDIELVYHLAAVVVSHDRTVFARVNRDGTANLLAEADAERVRHFVYISSASIVYPKRTPYAEAKLQAERLVERREGGYTIVRPTLVYDAHGGHELRMFFDYLRRFPVVPFIGQGRARKRPVWSEDVIDGLLRLGGDPVAFGKTYNLSGGEAIEMIELARLLMQHHRVERPIVCLPVGLCRAIAHLMARLTPRPPLTLNAIAGVIHDADLDPSAAMRDLGYAPIGVREGFERCFGRPNAEAFTAWERKGIQS